MLWACAGCGKEGIGVLPGDFRCPACGGRTMTAVGMPGPPPREVLQEIMVPDREPKGEPMNPTEVWAQVDRMGRIHCCHPTPGDKCEGYHAQGTRVVYGYEALAKGVQGAVFAARNGALEEAIGLVSELVPTEGAVLKSNVLEILSHLKLAGV